MVNKMNKKLIATGIIAIILIVLSAASVLLFALANNRGGSVVNGIHTSGAAFNVKTDDGKVNQQIGTDTAPDAAQLPISTDQDLDDFIAKTGKYADCDYGYFTNDITYDAVSRRPSASYGMSKSILEQGRVIDGNGYELINTVNLGSIANDWNKLTKDNMLQVDFGVAINMHWDSERAEGDPGRSNIVNAIGNFLAVNRGEIKNITVTTDYASTHKVALDYYIPTFASPFVGLNQGDIKNVRVNLGGTKFQLHRNVATSGDDGYSNRQAMMVGGVTGVNLGHIEDLTLNNNLDFEIITKAPWLAYSAVGGIAGKTLSMKKFTESNSSKTVYTDSYIKNSVVLGNSYMKTEATELSDQSKIKLAIGSVAGNNSVFSATNNAGNFYDADYEYFGNGLIDGIIVGYTGTLESYRKGTLNQTHQMALGCGEAGNVYYVNGTNAKRVSSCSCSGTIFHACVYASTIKFATEPKDGYVYDVSIDKENTNDGAFSVNVDLAINENVIDGVDKNLADVIFVMNLSKLTKADNGSAEGALNSSDAIGGYEYIMPNGDYNYFNAETAENNMKHASGKITETRSTTTSDDRGYVNLIIDFGSSASLEIDGLNAEYGTNSFMEFTGKNPELKLTGADGRQYENIKVESGITSFETEAALLDKNGKAKTLNIKSLIAPGTYKNTKVVSPFFVYAGYVDVANKVIADIYDLQKVIGEEQTLTINPAVITVTNPNDSDAAYREYEYNLNLSVTTDALSKIRYTTTKDGLIWNDVKSADILKPKFNSSTRKGGFDLSFSALMNLEIVPAAEDTAAEYMDVRFTNETESINLVIDNDAPVIQYVDELGNNIEKPDFDLMTWSNQSATLRFKASDELTAVSKVIINGNPVVPDENGIYSYEVRDDEIINIEIEDTVTGGNNVLTDAVRYKIDMVNPEITITNVLENGVLNVNSNAEINFNVTAGDSGYTVFMMESADNGATYGEPSEITLDGGSFIITKNGRSDLKFYIVNGVGTVSDETSVIVIVNKTTVTLTIDDISIDSSVGVGISKYYDGNDKVSDADAAKITWNTSSPQYNAILKDLGMELRFTSPNAGSNNPVRIIPIDSQGIYEFVIDESLYIRGSIMPKRLTIEIGSATRQYASADPIFDYELTGILAKDKALFVNSNIFSLITDADVYTPAGSRMSIYTDLNKDEINACLAAFDESNPLRNYEVAKIINGDYSITPKQLNSNIISIDESQLGSNYTGNAINVVATYELNGEWLPLKVLYYKDGVLLENAPKDVGAYTIELVIEDSNYILINDIKYEVNIHKAKAEIEFDGFDADNTRNIVYNGVGEELQLIVKENGEEPDATTVEYRDESDNVLALDGMPVNAGKYKIVIKFAPGEESNFLPTDKVYYYNIDQANFKSNGVTFESKKVQYNAGNHRIEVAFPTDGLPGIDIEEVKSNITINIGDTLLNQYHFEAKDVGKHNVTATIVDINGNYMTETMTAVLEITKTQMEGVNFDGGKFVYDGTAKTVTLIGLPEFASVIFTVNASIYTPDPDAAFSVTQTNAGVYAITATVSAPGYENKVVTGTLNIEKAAYNGYVFESKSVDYNGEYHSLVYSGFGENDNVVLKINNNEGDGEILSAADGTQYFRASKAGVYRINLTVTAKDGNYKPLSINAVLNINALTMTEADVTALGYNVIFEDGRTYEFKVIVNLPGVTVKVECDAEGVITDDGSSLKYYMTKAGTYKFVVTASKDNYKDFVIKTSVWIKEAEFEAYFSGETTGTYEKGKNYTATLNNVPDDTELIWSIPDGVTLNEAERTVYAFNQGTYDVTVTLKKANYRTSNLKVRISVYSASMPNEVIESMRDNVLEYRNEGYEFRVSGAPDDSVISVNVEKDGAAYPVNADNTVTLNDKGSYKFSVSVAAPNYNTFSKTFTWTVTDANITTVTGEDREYYYDGSEKGVMLTGVPEGAKVYFTYRDNETEVFADTEGEYAGCYVFRQSDAGSYYVKYRVTMDNHRDLTGSMRLSIVENDFNDVTIANHTAVYDKNGVFYDIDSQLPKFDDLIITYEYDDGVIIDSANNVIRIDNVKVNQFGRVEPYSITVTLERINYKTKKITFYVTVNQQSIDSLVSVDETQSTVFDGGDKTISIDKLPDNAEVTYNGQESFKARNAGVYTVNVSVSIGANYKTFSKEIKFTIEKAKMPQFYYGNYVFNWEPDMAEPFSISVTDADGNPIDTDKYNVNWLIKNEYVNAGSYSTFATVTMKGEESNYETVKVLTVPAESEQSTNIITCIVKPKAIEEAIDLIIAQGSNNKPYDGQAVVVDISGVPDGYTVSWTSKTQFVDAGNYEAKAIVSKTNYEPLEVSLNISIYQKEVDVKYIKMPSYAEYEQPRVVGIYTDINGKEVKFLVDTSEVYDMEEGTYNIYVYEVGDSNYVPTEETSELEIVIGKITATNVPAIVGGSVGGSAAVGGGVAALVIVLLKRKRIRL